MIVWLSLSCSDCKTTCLLLDQAALSCMLLSDVLMCLCSIHQGHASFEMRSEARLVVLNMLGLFCRVMELS